jgi:dipeptide/tripeptide permease
LAHRDNAWFGVQDDVTTCLACVPALLVGNITFNIQYNTMASLFYSQACQMDTRVGGTQLNAAILSLADSIAIVVFTPIFNQCAFPCIKRCIGREVSLNMKIYTGILFAIGSQVVAAILEEIRKDAPVLDIGSVCAPEVDGEHVRMSDMSVWWMAIPYMMIGIGEILVNPVLQHTAYEGAPESMRSMLQAFNLFAMGGMPNAVAAGISLATRKYTPNNLNNGNLKVVYMLNCFIGVVGMFLWWALCKRRQVREALLTGDGSQIVVGPLGTSAISVLSDRHV